MNIFEYLLNTFQLIYDWINYLIMLYIDIGCHIQDDPMSPFIYFESITHLHLSQTSLENFVLHMHDILVVLYICSHLPNAKSSCNS